MKMGSPATVVHLRRGLVRAVLEFQSERRVEVNWLADTVLHLLVRNLALCRGPRTADPFQAERAREPYASFPREAALASDDEASPERPSRCHGGARPTRKAQRSRREEGNLSVSPHREG